MNMSKCISAIMMKLGLYTITLPFKDPVSGEPVSSENIIRNVLTTITIPEYSEFQPWIREGNAHLKDLTCVDPREGIYILPSFLTFTPIKSVLDVRLPFKNMGGVYGDIAPVYGINRSVQGVLTGQAYMMVTGQMRAEPSFDYLGFNKIKLYGFPKTILTFVVSCEHEPNGETIEDSCYDSFMELAMLDCKSALYENLKYFDEIPTAFGAIKLKIDGWQSADSERTALLNDWRQVFHLDLPIEEFM